MGNCVHSRVNALANDGTRDTLTGNMSDGGTFPYGAGNSSIRGLTESSSASSSEERVANDAMPIGSSRRPGSRRRRNLMGRTARGEVLLGMSVMDKKESMVVTDSERERLTLTDADLELIDVLCTSSESLGQELLSWNEKTRQAVRYWSARAQGDTVRKIIENTSCWTNPVTREDVKLWYALGLIAVDTRLLSHRMGGHIRAVLLGESGQSFNGPVGLRVLETVIRCMSALVNWCQNSNRLIQHL